jgi:hypothetical protein
MMVKVKDITPEAERSRRRGTTAEQAILLTAWIGLFVGFSAFGGVVWAINGGYSVRGLAIFASAFNEAGALFWGIVSRWTFTIPGTASQQPVIPWSVVVSASLLQVSTLLLRLLGRDPPMLLVMATVAFSLYDVGTTFAGLTEAEWLAGVGYLWLALVAIVLTFIVEIVLAWLLRNLVRAVRRSAPK